MARPLTEPPSHPSAALIQPLFICVLFMSLRFIVVDLSFLFSDCTPVVFVVVHLHTFQTDVSCARTAHPHGSLIEQNT